MAAIATPNDGAHLPKKRMGMNEPQVTSLPSSMFVANFVNKSGVVDVDRVANAFRMTKSQLAETVGLRAATISKSERRNAPRTQWRVREMLEIVARIREWAGGETQAMAWYRSQPIPALDGRTPEALVKAGEAGAVRDYLDHLALGGFA
ncbi:MAG: antitoxin Xre/MbcA/ParS toxin-binding domain-containing protein [Novosphingobium sp.]